MILSIQNIDRIILQYIQNNFHSPAMDNVMVIFTHLGEQGLVWIAIALLLMIRKKTRYVSFIVLGALLLNALLGEVILKNVIQRARPFAGMTKESLLIAKPLSYSFPSGHTASSFAAAGVLSNYYKKYAPVFFILASLIAFSRLYLYVHYPTDVLGGIILGLISSRIAIYAFSRLKSMYSSGN